MTIQEFKNIFGFLNPKFKANVPLDYIITNSDIISGRIIQKYVNNENLSNIINGFSVINDEIYYIYPKVNKIDILFAGIFPPCGGSVEIPVYAMYDIHIIDIKGNDRIYEKDKTSKINALISVDNPDYKVIKSELFNDKINNTGEDKEINVSATYYYKGIKYTCSKKITQPTNSISSWIIDKETTTNVFVSINKQDFYGSGGVTTFKVEREFTRSYYKKDVCGNKISEKKETEHIEDITNDCDVICSDRKMASINKNIIAISKQEPNAPKRKCIISIKFDGFEVTEELTQLDGAKIKYEYELLFKDETENKLIDLKTSLNKTIKVPLISKKYKYVDNSFDGFSNTTNINAESDSDWLTCSINKDNNEDIFAIISAIKPNINKHNSREGIITLTNNDDNRKKIELIISQKQLLPINEFFTCKFYGEGIYSYEDFNSADIYFKVFRNVVFEDNSIETYEYNKPLDFKVSFLSSENNLLSLSDVNYNNGKYIVNFLNLAENSISDIFVKIKIIFDDIKITSDIGNITVKGNTSFDFQYDFCFKENKKTYDLRWFNSNDKKEIDIVSIKYFLKNNSVIKIEQIPFTINCPDKFLFEVKDNKKLIFQPNKINNSISSKCIITQEQTNSSIELNLNYINDELKNDIPLKVILSSKITDYDLWTNYGGYLVIDDNIKIKLNPCWISTIMKNKYDIAYDGKISLTEGEHMFKTIGVLCMNSNNKSYQNINVEEKVVINEKTNGIVLTMVV